MRNECLCSSLLPCLCGTTVFICIFGAEGILRFFPIQLVKFIAAIQSAPQRNWAGAADLGTAGKEVLSC